MFKITVKIDGMGCTMCEKHVNETIENSFKVKKVTSSFKDGQAEIIADSEISLEALKAVLDSTGYIAVTAECEPYKKTGLFG